MNKLFHEQCAFAQLRYTLRSHFTFGSIANYLANTLSNFEISLSNKISKSLILFNWSIFDKPDWTSNGLTALKLSDCIVYINNLWCSEKPYSICQLDQSETNRRMCKHNRITNILREIFYFHRFLNSSRYNGIMHDVSEYMCKK